MQRKLGSRCKQGVVKTAEHPDFTDSGKEHMKMFWDLLFACAAGLIMVVGFGILTMCGIFAMPITLLCILIWGTCEKLFVRRK